MRVLHSLSSTAREHVFFAMLGIPRLLCHPVWRNADPGQGAGLGVLLVPGFGAADVSLSLTGTWLRDRGYRPASAHIGFNVGCTTQLAGRVEQRLEQHVDATGGRVVLLGQSRGGSLAKLVAVRRPDLVRGLVTLGSPLRDPMDVHPQVLLAVKALARLSATGVPGLMNDDCLSGTCFRDNMTAAATPLSPDVPAVSVYSKADGIVPWRLSLDPYADCVEVRSTHTGMGFDPAVYTALEPRLASWTTEQQPALASAICD